jgi:hypothetical protein
VRFGAAAPRAGGGVSCGGTALRDRGISTGSGRVGAN